MGPLFSNKSINQHNNFVGKLGRRNTMRNNYRRPSLHNPFHAVENIVLGFRVNG